MCNATLPLVRPAFGPEATLELAEKRRDLAERYICAQQRKDSSLEETMGDVGENLVERLPKNVTPSGFPAHPEDAIDNEDREFVDKKGRAPSRWVKTHDARRLHCILVYGGHGEPHLLQPGFLLLWYPKTRWHGARGGAASTRLRSVLPSPPEAPVPRRTTDFAAAFSVNVARAEECIALTTFTINTEHPPK
ncbi:hypothetical protein EYF80_023813 [Liparis tanakae]|uniref:Uncharacterized protein n=1 Tax=Liparis tanakae TaxID=230148 RepID=A0A4Z2HK21_9TELE|nr:hypothetical protein EYF80_023813 [Liparis tanakae]